MGICMYSIFPFPPILIPIPVKRALRSYSHGTHGNSRILFTSTRRSNRGRVLVVTAAQLVTTVSVLLGRAARSMLDNNRFLSTVRRIHKLWHGFRLFPSALSQSLITAMNFLLPLGGVYTSKRHKNAKKSLGQLSPKYYLLGLVVVGLFAALQKVGYGKQNTLSICL